MLCSRCIDRKTSVEYAVKIIDVTKDNDIHEGLNPIQQVQREVEILKRLQGHPYIIQLVESYQVCSLLPPFLHESGRALTIKYY